MRSRYRQTGAFQSSYSGPGPGTYVPGPVYVCTLSYNLTYANGEIRHEDVQQECVPT